MPRAMPQTDRNHDHEGRDQLVETWKMLALRAASRGVPETEVAETMLDVAANLYRERFGDDMLGNYLRDLLLRFDQPLSEQEVAEELIYGPDEEETEPGEVPIPSQAAR